MATKKLAVKKPTAKKSVIKKLPAPCDPGTTPTGTSKKVIRDVLYSWLYVSVGQINNIPAQGDPGTIADGFIACLVQNDPSGVPRVNVSPQLRKDVIAWVTAIQKDKNCYGVLTTFMNILKASGAIQRIPQPWTGTPDHPALGELDAIMTQF